jgi:anti-sigma factor (TIGR02949 family)
MSEQNQPDAYTCERAFARLYEYLDQVLGPEEEKRVQEHLAICEGCTRHFKFESDLLEKIREKCRTSRAPEALRRKVEALLDQL